MSPPIEMRPRGGQRRKDLCRLENIREMTCIVAHVISRDTTRGHAATNDIYKLPIKSLCNYIEQYTTFKIFCRIIFFMIFCYNKICYNYYKHDTFVNALVLIFWKQRISTDYCFCFCVFFKLLYFSDKCYKLCHNLISTLLYDSIVRSWRFMGFCYCY